MRTVYLDSDYMCHVTDDGSRQEIETDCFDDLCDNAVEFMRFVPEGKTWTRPDGRVIHGEFIQATDSKKIDEYQLHAYIADMQNALEILGVSP